MGGGEKSGNRVEKRGGGERKEKNVGEAYREEKVYMKRVKKRKRQQ